MKNEEKIIYRAAMILVDGQFVRDAALLVSGGRIERVLREKIAAHRFNTGSRVVDLGSVALIPGQINVHSHAFQRSLRGKTEYREGGQADDFWTWRVAMYELANRVEPDEMEIIARLAFWEMARAGITHVGEFHYLHHRPDGTAYGEPNEMALRVAKAAREVGIRMTLLPVAYHTGDIGKAAGSEQRRFISPDVETYLERVAALEEEFSTDELVDVGVAPHSIRAVSREWMEAIGAWAQKRSMPVHIHVCEQRREVESSQKAYGVPPIEALHDWGVLKDFWTLIHGTHLSKREVDILAEVGPTIGACPTTERNLGDGFLPASDLVSRAIPIALGSDSHTVIDPFEEMRLVEYHERLRREERNVLVGVDPGGRRQSADVLWPMGTTHGARSLQSAGGEIRDGGPADFVVLDLEHPSLVGATEQSLLSDVVLSMSAGAVRDVIVAGEAIIVERHHDKELEITGEYRELMARYGS